MKERFYKQLKADSWQVGKRLLLAVSGGADSMAMAKLAKGLGLDFGIAHVNYQLRGEDSDQDEALVKSWAEKEGIEFYLLKLNTRDLLEDTSDSLQILARKARYSWFEELRKEKNYDFICTAHHLEDSIETLLMNLDRGTGIRGLGGIQSHDVILRPMQNFSKEEILAYVKKEQVNYREDASNHKEDYQRNWFRHNLVRTWKEKNPQLMNTMAENFAHFRSAIQVFEKAIETDLKEIKSEFEKGEISLAKIASLQFREESMRCLLAEKGFNANQVAEILQAISKERVGVEWHSVEFRIILDRNHLFLQERGKVQVSGQYSIFNFQSALEYPIKITFSMMNPKDCSPSESSKVEHINWDKLQFPLQLRKWKEGDKMKPLGMKGRKKISDLLIDLKIPKQQKEATWVLCSGDEIVWLVGHRLSDKFKVDSNCKQVYQVKIHD